MKASKLNRSVVKLFAAVALCASLNQAGMAAFMGINFPPTQGSSGTGAFLAGIYNYNYSNTDIKNSHTTFDMERIAINVATANDPASLTKIKGYVDQFNGYAIICMFDTLQSGQSGHGDGLPVFRVGAFDLPLSGAFGHSGGSTAQERAVGVVRQTSALRLSADGGVAAPERLARGQAAHSTTTASGRTACATDQAKDHSPWCIYWFADHGDASKPCLDVGLHRGRHGARRRVADVDHLG